MHHTAKKSMTTKLRKGSKTLETAIIAVQQRNNATILYRCYSEYYGEEFARTPLNG